jgi:hypothetical protein
LLTTCSSSLFLLYQIIDGDEKLQTMHDAAEKYSPQTEVVFKYLQVGGGGGVTDAGYQWQVVVLSCAVEWGGCWHLSLLLC